MYVKINGVRLYLDVEGSGYVASGDGMVEKPPCLLIHGGPGSDHTVYKPWLSPLSEHFQLVHLDLRGNGRSEPSSLDTYTIAQMADDLECIREHLGFGKLVVFGNSFGGMVAQSYAVKYLESISRLILCDTVPSYDFVDEVRAMAPHFAETPEQELMLPKLVEGALKTPEELRQWSEICYPLLFRRRDEGIMRRHASRILARADIALHMWANEIPHYDVREELKRLEVATLVMVGRHDPVMPVSQSEEIHDLLPDSRLRVYENSAHLPYIDEQETFLRDFLDFALNGTAANGGGTPLAAKPSWPQTTVGGSDVRWAASIRQAR